MKFRARWLLSAVYLFYSCLANAGVTAKEIERFRDKTVICNLWGTPYLHLCVGLRDQSDPSTTFLRYSLLKAKNLIYEKNRVLFEELVDAEEEFDEIYRKVIVSYHVLMSYSKSRVPIKVDFSKPDRIPMMAFPRSFTVGGVNRAAINFYDARIIVFDSTYWNSASLSEKKLLVLTEILRFKGIEEEDDRYFAAVRILHHLTVADGQPYLHFRINPAREAFEVFDKNKIFIGAVGEKSSNFAILNLENPMATAKSCRLGQPVRLMERWEQGLIGDPIMLPHCLRDILRKEDRSIPLSMYLTNHLIYTCGGI